MVNPFERETCFIIAEAGVNHNGDLNMARRLVEAAAAAGADAVKFQTFSAQRLVAASAPKAEYQKRDDASESQFDMLKKLELSREDHVVLQEHARQHGIEFLSSPFDVESLEMLVSLGVPKLKLGSGELTNFVLLEKAARTGLPLMISTGMAYLSEVDRAVRALESADCGPLGIFHCVSLYPTPISQVNLRAMDTLRMAFPSHTVGFSDHTIGPSACVAAVARGARLIEKHLTLDTSLPGPDHAASMDPPGFTDMVSQIRAVEHMLGDGNKRPADGEDEMRKIARRSIHAIVPIDKGQVIQENMLAVLRPGTGLGSEMWSHVVGARAARAVKAGEALQLGDFTRDLA